MKCPHTKTVTLYAQRLKDGKRAFKPEGRKCEACGAVLPAIEATENRGAP